MVVTMSMEDFYEVGNTGMYFGDGHKGGFSIIFKENKFFYMDYRLDGIADCIYSIYQALLDAPLREEHENSFVLRYEWLIRETAKKVWESNDYSFPKCFECTLKKESKRTDCLYCDIGWEESFYIEEGYPAFDLYAHHDRVDVMLRSGY